MYHLANINKAVQGLQRARNIIGKVGVNAYASQLIDVARVTLEGIKLDVNAIENERARAESQRDSLLLAIAGTDAGRHLDITQTDDAIPQAINAVRLMDADIRTSREAEDIPFGAVEQDRDTMQLEQRVAELELQLELKVDECAETENHLREFKARWVSLINLINKFDPDGLSIGKQMTGTLLGTEEVISRRQYANNGCDIGQATIQTRHETGSHELRVTPDFFQAILSGQKKAEIAHTDRWFSVGDELWLREWTVQDGYTGRDVYRTITHITNIKDYAPGYVMLSIES